MKNHLAHWQEKRRFSVAEKNESFQVFTTSDKCRNYIAHTLVCFSWAHIFTRNQLERKTGRSRDWADLFLLFRFWIVGCDMSRVAPISQQPSTFSSKQPFSSFAFMAQRSDWAWSLRFPRKIPARLRVFRICLLQLTTEIAGFVWSPHKARIPFCTRNVLPVHYFHFFNDVMPAAV